MSAEYTHNLKTPFEYEGNVYETIDFDYGKLTGDDAVAIEQEIQDESGKFEYVVPVFSKDYQVRLAAHASGIAANVLRAMPLKEFNKITNSARSFLLSSE